MGLLFIMAVSEEHLKSDCKHGELAKGFLWHMFV